MDPLPKRKPNRLTGYDYSQPGAYFITICAKGRHAIFGTVCVGRDDLGAPYVKLSKYGTVVENYICSIGQADRKSTRLNSSHLKLSRMPSSA